MNNEIHLAVAELKQALPGFTKIISKGTTLPVLQHLRIQRDPDGEILVHATNLDDFGSVKLAEKQPGQAIDTLVPFESIARFTKASAAKDALTLKLLPSASEAVLAYPLGNTFAEQKLQTLPTEEWPVIPTVNQSAMTVDDHFKAALNTAFDCSSTDDTRKVLQGACLDVTDLRNHYVVGTDGKHLFSANSFKFDLLESVIIPNRRFLGWSGFVQDGPWRLSQLSTMGDKPGWIQIESNRWTFITRQIEGKYPEWRLPFPDPSSDCTTVNLEDSAVQFLLSVIPKLPASEQSQAVSLVVDKKQLLIQARAHEADDWTTIPIQGVQIQGKATAININRAYLIKGLKLGMTEWELRSPDSPMILQSKGQKLLVAPLRFSSNVRTPTKEESPPPVQTQNPEPNPEPKESMKTVNRTDTATDQNAKTEHETTESKASALQQAAEQIERIKDTLKGMVSDLNEALKVITQAQKEKRATEKEIESIRDSLRALQKVKI